MTGDTDDDTGADADTGTGADGADGTVRCWLVDRRSYDENLVTLVYATPDGERHWTRQLSFQLLTRQEVTAARDVPVEKLEETAGEEERERYATQAQAMAERHDPGETV
ncbi:MAG: hypothetical protein ABEJ40_10610 [Haloarculaceae archaeon]